MNDGLSYSHHSSHILRAEKHNETNGRTNERTDDKSHGIVTVRNVQPAFHDAFSAVCGRIELLPSEREEKLTSTPVASIVSTPTASTVGQSTKVNKSYAKTTPALQARSSQRAGFAMLARANLSECGSSWAHSFQNVAGCCDRFRTCNAYADSQTYTVLWLR